MRKEDAGTGKVESKIRSVNKRITRTLSREPTVEKREEPDNY